MSGRAIERAKERHSFRFLPGRQLPLFAVMAGLLGCNVMGRERPHPFDGGPLLGSAGGSSHGFLNVSNLSESINGVQAVISYNPELLLLSDISRGDGVGSPWDSAFELFEQTASEEIMYALAIPASGTDQDAVVARLEFEGLAGGVVSLELRLAADSLPSFLTKLTGHPHGNPITPNLGDPLAGTGGGQRRYTGTIASLSAIVDEAPTRFRLLPNRPVWGRGLVVGLNQGVQLIPGEAVAIILSNDAGRPSVGSESQPSDRGAVKEQNRRQES